MKMELYIKVSLKEIANKGMAYKNGMMVQNMKEIGKIIWCTVKVNFSMPMEIFMKDSGKKAQKMVLEFIDFQMEIYMKETGILISIKDMAK